MKSIKLRLLRVILMGVLIVGSMHWPLIAMDSSQQDTLISERIRVVTIAHFDTALKVMDEEQRKSPQQKCCGISDWDLTLIGISNVDRARFHRQDNTKVLFEGWKSLMPVFSATARWHRNYSIDQFKAYAESMEKGTGIRLSDQEPFKNLVIDLRLISQIDRGVFINGIYFTGSRKGLMTSFLLNQPEMPNFDHYFFIDDDRTYIDQMVESFKARKEKLTVFYYPEQIEISIGHTFYLNELVEQTAIRKLSFYIRHSYKDHVRDLLSDTSSLLQITSLNLVPLFIDLTYCKCEETAEVVIRTLNLKPEMLEDEDRAIFYGCLQHEMGKNPHEFTWAAKYVNALKPDSIKEAL